MINSKQRAALRSMAQNVKPFLNVGKGGINDNTVGEIVQALDAHELVKISVLKTCEATAKEIVDNLAAATGSEPVQVIGGKIVLYKRSKRDDVKHIEI